MRLTCEAAVVKRVKVQKSLGKTLKVAGGSLRPFDTEMTLAVRGATRRGKNVLVGMNDAKQIFEAARPTGTTGQSRYDALEKKTMAYIRGKYKFTDAADKLLRKMVAKTGGAQSKRTRDRSGLKAVQVRVAMGVKGLRSFGGV